MEDYPQQFIIESFGELYDFFQENNLLSVYNSKVRFSFVGFASTQKDVFCFLPKYMYSKLSDNCCEKNEYYFSARQVFDLLKSYQSYISSDNSSNEFYEISQNSASNEIEIAEFILKDYSDYGLWFFQSKVVGVEIEGDIEWDRTVSAIDALISNRKPYYFETINSRDCAFYDSIISDIHRWGVHHCFNRFGHILGFEQLNPDVFLKELSDIGESGFLISLLEKELIGCFKERDIKLLKSLIELIRFYYFPGDSAFSVLGKNKFEHVWESAVSFLLKNEKDLYINKIPKPKWTSKEFEFTDTVSGTLNPDIIIFHKNLTNNFVLLGDAKYYLIKFDDDNKKVINNPGVDDIIKQYFYQMVLSDKNQAFPWINDYNGIYNFLIFPKYFDVTIGDIFEVIGYVELPNDFLPIPIISVGINPEIVFDRFVKRVSFSESEFQLLLSKFSQQ